MIAFPALSDPLGVFAVFWPCLKSPGTAYVEPYDVVEFADQLASSKKEKERLTRRILGRFGCEQTVQCLFF